MKKKSAILYLCLVLFILIGVVISIIPVFTASTNTQTPSAVQASSDHCSSSGVCYVYVNGTNNRLYYDGAPIRFFGARVSVGSTGGSVVGPMDTIFAIAHANGLNYVKLTDYLPIRGSEWNSASDATTQYWNNLVEVVADAQSQGIFVSIDLNDYQQLLCSQGKSPYTLSVWQPFIKKIVDEFGVYSNVVDYELPGVVCANSHVAYSSLPGFYDSLAAMIHSTDQNRHLVSSGELSSSLPWKDIIAQPSIDMIGIDVASLSDMNNTMPDMLSMSANDNKPVNVEFGFAKGNGCPSSTALTQSDFTGLLSDACRAGVYGLVLDTVNELSHYANADFVNLSPSTNIGSDSVWDSSTNIWFVIHQYVLLYTLDDPTLATETIPTATPTPMPAAAAVTSISTVSDTSTQETISWKTTNPTGTTINYGTASNMLAPIPSIQITPTLSHTVTITKLKANTTYYFQIHCIDGQGVDHASSVQTFTTAS